MIILCYVNDCLFFGPDRGRNEEFIKELKDSGMALMVEDDVYAFLGVKIKTCKENGEIALTQSGLSRKVLRAT
jgi:hypothetical protein